MVALLQSELRIEERLQGILETSRGSDSGAQWLIDAAMAPRAAYRAWLADNLGTAKDNRPARHYPAIDPLFASLIAVLEHLIVRAFVAWHGGDRGAADQAWASSGVAMVQVTELVNALTDLDAAPLATDAFPAGVPNSLGDTLVERDLMAAYARSAAAAMQTTEPALQAICARIVAYTEAMCAWRPGTLHPALASCAPSFRSFAATHAKFVQPPG